MDGCIHMSPGDTITPIEIDWERFALEQMAALRVIEVLLRDKNNTDEALSVAREALAVWKTTAAMRFVMTSTRDPA